MSIKNWARVSLLEFISAIALVVASAIALSVSGTITNAATITHEFTPEEDLVTGNIVSVDTDSKTVFKTTADNINLMYGVVANKGSIAFSDTRSGEETSGSMAVANSGIMPVLVSTMNGDIKEGDPITVKSLSGVGEKASTSGRIIGVALTGLNTETKDARQTTVEYKGEQKQVYIGTVSVKVGASDYAPPTSPINQSDSQNRNMLEKIADNLVGKVVKPLGIIVAGLILLSGAFASIFMITSSSYSSMISIGRNPLAEKKVIKSLVGLVFLAIGIFGVSIGLSYLALVLLG